MIIELYCKFKLILTANKTPIVKFRIFYFSCGSHLWIRVWLLNTVLNDDYTRTIPTRFDERVLKCVYVNSRLICISSKSVSPYILAKVGLLTGHISIYHKDDLAQLCGSNWLNGFRRKDIWKSSRQQTDDDGCQKIYVLRVKTHSQYQKWHLSRWTPLSVTHRWSRYYTLNCSLMNAVEK